MSPSEDVDDQVDSEVVLQRGWTDGNDSLEDNENLFLQGRLLVLLGNADPDLGEGGALPSLIGDIPNSSGEDTVDHFFRRASGDDEQEHDWESPCSGWSGDDRPEGVLE